jgi:hypothetical protein
MQQIAGLGMAGAGIAGAFSGFGKKEGGLVGLAKGGKVLRRAEGGLGREPVDIEGVDIPADGGGLSQVNILASMDTDSLTKAKDNPRFSRTLVEQELSKREPSVYAKQQASYKDYLKSKQDNTSYGKPVSGLSAGEIDFSSNTPSGLTATTKETSPDREKALDELYADLGVGSKAQKAPETQYILGTGPDQKVAEDGPAGPLLKGNDIASQYKPVPIADLKQTLEAKKTAAVEQSPQAEGLANDIYSDAISKLQASTDKKKTAMSERAAGLDQAKWLAVADMGFQMMAAPGGATLIQALGGAAGKSGIAGKIANLNDKQKEMAFNLAEMDEKQIMNTFGINQAQASQANEQAKLGLMARELDIKIIHEDNVEKKAQLQALKDRLTIGIDVANANANTKRADAAMLSAQNREPRAIRSVSKTNSEMIETMYNKLWDNAEDSSTVDKSWFGGTKKNYKDAFILEVDKRMSQGEDASKAASEVFKKLTAEGKK